MGREVIKSRGRALFPETQKIVGSKPNLVQYFLLHWAIKIDQTYLTVERCLYQDLVNKWSYLKGTWMTLQILIQ